MTKIKITKTGFENLGIRISKLGFRNLKSGGLSLLEIIIYIALLGMVAVFVSNSLIQIVNTYYRAVAEREIISNARLLIETLNKSIASSQEIYTPTSRFNNDAGQLSLITAINTQTGHTTSYVDYYLDNGRIWVKAEGQANVPISASSVRITKFRLERITQGLNREAVKITLAVNAASSKFTASATLNLTTAVRGSY